jgi:hypothetical protein
MDINIIMKQTRKLTKNNQEILMIIIIETIGSGWFGKS